MKYSIITLFPQIVEAYIQESIIKRALSKQLIEIEILDLRQFTSLKNGQVDDYQFGGGPGMVLMLEPVVKAIEMVKTPNSWVLLTTPQGQTWNQALARQIVGTYDHLIIVCGHYEGFDERILNYVNQSISLGDYVLTGGELASLIILDSTTRILPHVINEESAENESFERGLLDYPVFTKPIDFRGYKVPEVLLSGHHAKIQKFREEQQLITTWKNRPDLIDETKLTKNQLSLLEILKKGAK